MGSIPAEKLKLFLRGRFFPVLLLSVLIISCSLLSMFFWVRPRSIIRDCKFQVASFEVLSHNNSAVVFRLSVNISNPDFQSAQLDPLSFVIILDGCDEPLAHGGTDESYTIPPHGSSTVALLLRVQDSPHLSSFLEYLIMGRAELTISGSMRSALLIPWKIPFSLSYVLEETDKPLGEIVRLATIGAMPPGTRFNATMTFTNPSTIPLNISSLSFTVTNTSSYHLLKGVLASPVKFCSSNSVNTSVIIDVEKTGFEWLLGRMMSNATAVLVVDGSVSAELYGLKPTFNYSRSFEFFHPMEQLKLNRTEFASAVFSSVERGPYHVNFEVPFEINTPIDLNLSSINFELYNETSSHVGFGYTSLIKPKPLTTQCWTKVPISINLTLPAFNRLAIRFFLDEHVHLELRNGVFSFSIYQTEYNVFFDRKLQISHN